MDRSSPKRAGIGDVDEHPRWLATGDGNVRVRNLSSRHRKLLNTFEIDLAEQRGGADDVGHREALAALLEFYYANPDRVVKEAAGGEFR